MRTLKEFTGVYPVQKTLRFKLNPVGRTLEFITSSGLLEQDNKRAESYILVKKIIDEYHKQFISSVLKNTKLDVESKGNNNSLEEFYTAYMCDSKEQSHKKIFENIQENLRKQIAKKFSEDERFSRIDKKELIREDLGKFVVSDEQRELINEFKDFTTYFVGFHENRKNMYSAEAQSTAIAYRLIHENLPRFIDNMNAFERIALSPVNEHFEELYHDIEEYLNVQHIKEIFQLDYFNEVLSQEQIDVYNLIIGGKTLDDGTKIKGLNEYINLYNQTQKDKSKRVPKLKPLYKQILSDRNTISWLPEQFESDEEVLEAILKSYQELDKQVFNRSIQGEHSLKELLLSLPDYNLNNIYICNDQQLTDISNKAFGNWAVITKALIDELRLSVTKTKKESIEEYEERLGKILKSQRSISIGQINSCVQVHSQVKASTIEDYFASLGATSEEENLFAQIESAYISVKDLLNTPYPSEKNLSQDKNNVEKIKNLLDSIKNLQHFIKPLLGDGTESDKDNRFYGEFATFWEELDKITPLYNMVRNYMTRKPYSTEKIKLNFENSQLMSGWDLNKEQDNTTVILRKDGLYYLAIMNKKHKKVFDVKSMPTDGECYEKMEYKFFKDLTTMVPKCTTQLKDVKNHFQKNESPYIIKKDNFKSEFIITKEEFDLNNVLYNGKKKFQIDYLRQTGDKEGYKDALTKWINFCLRFLSYYKSTMIYNISSFLKENKIKSYTSIDEFYSEINMYLYQISFRNVSAEYIHELVDQGKIYLFQIYNKDFSPFSKGTPNLHTLYWKMLFDERNLADVVYKLNGQAEVFFRKSSINSERPTHPANQAINNKNALNKKRQSVFSYDLIKDKRYTVDQFQFHVPITMNFKSTGGGYINNSVNEYIQQASDLHIIGIDRGERHLLYITVIDLNGNIKKQYSLNEIINTHNGNEYHTNYHDLLKNREGDRTKARQSWQTIENIKDLKEGYLSQVVHKISELIVEYNAIVVLEDLNMGFKRGRQKVEHSVYQKFEKMLIDKLNYLADKKKTPTEPGGILNAYQLTNKFESFQKLGKQSGFLFYTQAWNTSKIDPVTGFVNLFDTRYETIEKSRTFLSKFDSIIYNKDKDWFEFTFDYSNFTTKADGTRTKWTICTYGKRVETYRDETQNSNWASHKIDLTEKFKFFFNGYKVDIHSNLKESIVQQDSAKFFKELLYLLKLTLQMRNSETGTDVDYLQSPVADSNGIFYNSNTCDSSLPQNADANGAYNIALKGLWIVREIKAAENLDNLKLAISNKEWLQFAQTKPYLND